MALCTSESPRLSQGEFGVESPRQTRRRPGPTRLTRPDGGLSVSSVWASTVRAEVPVRTQPGNVGVMGWVSAPRKAPRLESEEADVPLPSGPVG